MIRLLLTFLAGVCVCSSAAIPRRDESILLNAILNVSSNKNAQSKGPERATWTRFKPIFLHGMQKDGKENLGDKDSSNEVAAVLQKSLSRDEDEWFGEKENPKNVNSSETLIKTRMTNNEHQNNSANDSFNISENEKDIKYEDIDIGKASAIPNESSSENILEPLEMSKRNNSSIFALNFTDYATDFYVFSEDLNSIESLSVDENDLMSDGSEIALFQELPTTGFELLIDSETRKNLILTQLLASQSLLTDEVEDFEESMTFDPVPIKLNVDENDAEFNITPTQDIFNLTKDWYALPEAAEGKDDTFNLNVTDDNKNGRIANVEFTDLLEQSSFFHSETIPVSLDGNTEAEIRPVKVTFNELKALDTLPEAGSDSKDFTRNRSDFEYDGHKKSNTDPQNFVEDVSVPETPLFNFAENAEFHKTAQEPETLNLANSQELFGKENMESEIFNLNSTNIRGDIIKSNNFADLNESLATGHVGVDENWNEELNTKVPMQESLNQIGSDTLQSTEDKEIGKLQSNITDFNYDRASSKMKLTNFEESLNSSPETLQFTHSVDENVKTKLNATQEIFSLANYDILSEETKTKFVSNSSINSNESTEIGEFLGLEEESRDFIPNTQSSKLDKKGEDALSMVVSFEETLNMESNSEVFYEAEVTESFNLNTTDTSRIITELEAFTDIEAATTVNPSFNLDGNSGSELNMTSIAQTFGVFSEQNKTVTESFSLNVTDILHGRTTQLMKDAMAKPPPSCPASGICLLWFFARDSCKEDNQCHSTQKCCKSGCSKICMDV